VSFGKYLRELRQAKNITQKELAHKVGVDYTYLSKIENGWMCSPSEDILIKMAYELDEDVHRFILKAQKLPSSISDYMIKFPEASDLIRELASNYLTEEDIRGIKEVVKEKLIGIK